MVTENCIFHAIEDNSDVFSVRSTSEVCVEGIVLHFVKLNEHLLDERLCCFTITLRSCELEMSSKSTSING